MNKEVETYKLFRQLEAREKRANPYKFYDKDELIDEILKDEDEIERLNNIIKQYDKVSFIHEMELQKRIDKAIEYLKVREYETECCEVCDTMSNRILEILNKGNDKVEIIEEDKKIEELDIYNCFHIMGDNEVSRLRLDDNFKNISDKINEIIDYINKGE